MSASALVASPVPRGAASTSKPVTADEAVEVVRSYYQAINDRDYQAAYALLSPELRQQSLSTFAAGFAGTVRDDVEILSAEPGRSGRPGVSVRITAHHADGSTPVVEGTYVIGREGGVSRIVEADVGQQVPSVLVATPPAPLSSSGPLPCAPEQIDLSIAAQEAAGELAITVTITANSDPCYLSPDVTLSVEGADG
jgi:hypothetical protein